MGSRPSLIAFAIARLDSLMAIGTSRHQAKVALREAADEPCWNLSTGVIHSHQTRKTYQQQILEFIHWAQATHHIRQPAHLDSRADELVSQYLREGIASGKSPSTLSTQRCALRLFFGWPLAADVVLPQRTRATITRSRQPVKQDRHFQPKHWPNQILVAQATGLRRSELRDLRVGDIAQSDDGHVTVLVRNGKGGKARVVPVLSGYEAPLLALITGRDPTEHVVPHVPKNLDVQSLRRAHAQHRYLLAAPGRALPPQEGRLKPSDYDARSVQQVSWALGHNRRSVVLTHYLR